MKWRDLLYFSRGERRALTVLTCLITAAWVALFYKDTSQARNAEPVRIIQTDTIYVTTERPDSVQPPQPVPRDSQPPAVRYSRRQQMVKSRYPKTEKYPKGTIVELNGADTTSLKKVPGIGSTFARRIVKYRNLLGGFCTVEQLGEVYGIDEERYEAMKSWFSVEVSAVCQLKVNQLSAKKLASHPYVSYQQAAVIEQLVKQRGQISGWDELMQCKEFTEEDRMLLQPYFSFD